MEYIAWQFSLVSPFFAQRGLEIAYSFRVIRCIISPNGFGLPLMIRTCNIFCHILCKRSGSRAAIGVIPAEPLWANPDCGLKTRRWEQILPALKNLVAGAKIVRESASPKPAS